MESVIFLFSLSYHNIKDSLRLRGQAVKTSPFHGGNTGSIPVGVIFQKFYIDKYGNFGYNIKAIYGDIAKW